MDQNTPQFVKAKMARAMALIKEALDLSIPLFNTEQKNNIITLWEEFLGEFFSYIKQKSKETGINLISKISISKIWFK